MVRGRDGVPGYRVTSHVAPEVSVAAARATARHPVAVVCLVRGQQGSWGRVKGPRVPVRHTVIQNLTIKN